MAAVLAMLAGCAVSASTWPSARAEAECSLYQRCGLSEAFGSEADCRALLEAQEGAWLSDDGCDYSRQAARDCLNTLSSLGCEELNGERPDATASCDLVCGGGI